MTKIWKNRFFKEFFEKKFFFWIFKRIDFREFLNFLLDCLCKIKLSIHIFECKSFLPLTSFYPVFVDLHASQRRSFFCDSSHWWSFKLKKGGKKLVRGSKNFWFGKYRFSASFCTKNHVKMFKTRENRFLWNLAKNSRKTRFREFWQQIVRVGLYR